MPVCEKTPEQSVSLSELVPHICSLYSLQEMIEEAGHRVQNDAFRNSTFYIDLEEILSSGELQPGDRDPFLPWCFFRGIDLARTLGFRTVKVSCSPEDWESLRSLREVAAPLLGDISRI
ncbi:MAG: hypothetical protein PQJ58_06180 [Spirochaetales bacterium]|nr:hypothetical protein [Spirochaetales bacterium]